MDFRQKLRAGVLDWMMRQMNDLRPEALEDAEGEVLEVGFGTGLNLPLYPPGVKRVVGLDPNSADGLPALEQRVLDAPFEVERCGLRADGDLPFDAGRFDTIVTTWTLCSIPDGARALSEMRRVLKPSGELVFIEHGRSPDARVVAWQDRLTPLWRHCSGGCHMNRDIGAMIRAAGFAITRMRTGYMIKGPRPLTYHYEGAASRG